MDRSEMQDEILQSLKRIIQSLEEIDDHVVMFKAWQSNVDEQLEFLYSEIHRSRNAKQRPRPNKR